MNAKKCDVCGEYYTDNDNECGLDNCEQDAVTNIEIMCCQKFDTKLDLCDTCAERLIAWIKGDAIIIHKKTLGKAIEHARDVASKKYAEGMLCHANPNDEKLDSCIECAREHEQLAAWLQELQQYRQIGTVEECRKARKKQEAMTIEEIEEDYFVCPSCKMLIASLSDFDDHKYYLGCGQALKFTEREKIYE